MNRQVYLAEADTAMTACGARTPADVRDLISSLLLRLDANGADTQAELDQAIADWKAESQDD